MGRRHEGGGDGLAVGSELLAGFAGSGAWRGGRRNGGSPSGGDVPSGIAYIYKALIRRRLTGNAGINPRRGHPPRRLSPEQDLALAAHIRSRPGITLAQAQAWLQTEHGIELSTGAMWNAAKRLGLSFKKSPARCGAGPARRRRTPRTVESGSAVH